MDRFIAIMQIVGGTLLAVTAAVTIHNLWNIATRPETISVVNTIIGQGVIIVCLSALSTVLFRKGLKTLKSPAEAASDDDSSAS